MTNDVSMNDEVTEQFVKELNDIPIHRSPSRRKKSKPSVKQKDKLLTTRLKKKDNKKDNKKEDTTTDGFQKPGPRHSVKDNGPNPNQQAKKMAENNSKIAYNNSISALSDDDMEDQDEDGCDGRIDELQDNINTTMEDGLHNAFKPTPTKDKASTMTLNLDFDSGTEDISKETLLRDISEIIHLGQSNMLSIKQIVS